MMKRLEKLGPIGLRRKQQSWKKVASGHLSKFQPVDITAIIIVFPSFVLPTRSV